MVFYNNPVESNNANVLNQRGINKINKYQIEETDFKHRILSELVNSIGNDIICLTELPDGWDGHDGIPVKVELANFALRIINEIVCYNMPIPSVVPGSDGTLQIEWHMNGFDIEIDILEPNKFIAERLDLDGNNEPEITDDFSKLSEWIMELKVDRKAGKIIVSGFNRITQE